MMLNGMGVFMEKEEMKESGICMIESKSGKEKIQLITIIGEIEGHENLNGSAKTTKYEHILPLLGKIEEDDEVTGLLLLINTVGGDVEAGLAIAEMIASLSKPTCSLVLGGSHSIGVPIAVSTDYSFIVPSATMVIHPVRLNGTIIGVPQSFEYFEQIQNRIITFVTNHSKIEEKRLRELLSETEFLTKDIGSVLVGEETVKEGLICEVGGIKGALAKLHEMITIYKQNADKKP